MLVSVLARTRRFFARAAAGCPVARFRADRAAEVARLVFAALEFRVLLLDFLRVAIVTLSTRDRVPGAACRTVAPPIFRATEKPLAPSIRCPAAPKLEGEPRGSLLLTSYLARNSPQIKEDRTGDNFASTVGSHSGIGPAASRSVTLTRFR